jgi:hypothetical protein
MQKIEEKINFFIFIMQLFWPGDGLPPRGFKRGKHGKTELP